MNHVSPPPPTPWHADPLEIDRLLDGECTLAERASREREAATDPDLAGRLARRKAFLETLASARWAPNGLSAGHLDDLSRRVTTALAAQRAPFRRLWRPALASAAALLVGVAVWLGQGGRDVQAFDPVRLAAQVLSWKPRAFEALGTCASGGPGSDVRAFTLVRGGELEVTGCVERPAEPGTSVAVLRRPEQLPVVGYVAVPADPASRSGEVGITEVEDGRVIVFDVLDAGRRVYLAVDPRGLKRAGDSGSTWTCAACHGPARQALPNPHHIVLRRAP